MHLFFADYFLPYDPTEVTHGQIIEGSDDLPEGGESMSEYLLGVLVSFFHMSIYAFILPDDTSVILA